MPSKKYELTPSEKLTLVSCLNSRRSEYLDDESFQALYNYDYADWAENMTTLSKTISYIDNVHRLLNRFGKKKNYIIFQDIIDRIKKLKKCNKYLLVGKEDDYYKLSAIDDHFKVTTFGLKERVIVSGEFALSWIQRDTQWIEKEARNPLIEMVNKKEAWRLIKSCNYHKAQAPSEKMMRFLKVILR